MRENLSGREIVLGAKAADGHALQHASKLLQEDELIAKVAVYAKNIVPATIK